MEFINHSNFLDSSPSTTGGAPDTESKLRELERTVAEFEARILEATAKLRELQFLEGKAQAMFAR